MGPNRLFFLSHFDTEISWKLGILNGSISDGLLEISRLGKGMKQ